MDYNFYDIQHIDVLAGDTVDGILITLSDGEPSLYSMTATISKATAPLQKIAVIECGETEDGFTVSIPDTLTANMNGLYYVDFTLLSASKQYKRLRIEMHVQKSVGG